MTKLEKFELVNTCETIEELAQAILMIAEEGLIPGRRRDFNANQMSGYVGPVVRGLISANVLTREFGIRQQALYIKAYS